MIKSILSQVALKTPVLALETPTQPSKTLILALEIPILASRASNSGFPT